MTDGRRFLAVDGESWREACERAVAGDVVTIAEGFGVEDGAPYPAAGVAVECGGDRLHPRMTVTSPSGRRAWGLHDLADATGTALHVEDLPPGAMIGPAGMLLINAMVPPPDVLAADDDVPPGWDPKVTAPKAAPREADPAARERAAIVAYLCEWARIHGPHDGHNLLTAAAEIERGEHLEPADGG